MNLNNREEKTLNILIDIEEILAKCNIQQYYVEGIGFDFKSFVQMALDFDEKEAETITYTKLKNESLRTQVNKEDNFIDFSDEELNCIFFDVLNLRTA